MDLLSDSGSQNGNDTLKVNETFKAKFEHEERRKHLERGKNMYGELLDQNLEPASSSSEDDSDAELLNPRVEQKFLEVLTAIRNNDPNLKKVVEPIFEDEDFDRGAGLKKKQKAFTLKD